MGGTLTAESEPGKGSSFLLRLPLRLAGSSGETLPQAQLKTDGIQSAAANHNHQPAKEGAEETDERPLILIAEDNDELRDFMAEIFSANYRVLTAEDGRTGLEAAQEHLPDVIISDGMMPEMDGLEFCRAVKGGAATSHIAFVLLSARARHESVAAGLQVQADDYLTKPFHTDELLLRVGNIIARQ